MMKRYLIDLAVGFAMAVGLAMAAPAFADGGNSSKGLGSKPAGFSSCCDGPNGLTLLRQSPPMHRPNVKTAWNSGTGTGTGTHTGTYGGGTTSRWIIDEDSGIRIRVPSNGGMPRFFKVKRTPHGAAEPQKSSSKASKKAAAKQARAIEQYNALMVAQFTAECGGCSGSANY